MGITTKTGDNGKTSSFSCNCQSKGDYLFEVLGNLDELISHIGYEGWIGKVIQEQLFQICESLATRKPTACFALPIFNAICAWAEEQLKKDGKYPSDFIYAGTNEGARQSHITRAVCRRVERSLVRYRDEHGGQFDSTILKAINRLSDALYLLACYNEDKIIYVNRKDRNAK